jgi:CheY-like chemotaxis protein
VSTVDLVCVFVRAAAERLLAAERLVLALPQLFGPALAECDLAYRVSARTLVAVLRFSPEAYSPAVRQRLAFWAARAGGRATPITGLGEKELAAFRASFDACELKLVAVPPARLFEASAALFEGAGAPPVRRRVAGQRPVLAMDVGGPGWEGASYRADTRVLFVAGPMAPPKGDELHVAVRVPGSARPVEGRARVAGVRSAEDAAPGRPAGYALEIAPEPPALREALAAHVPAPTGSDIRISPRFAVKAPVRIQARDAQAAAPAGEPSRATIEYASGEELKADFIENLSQGGAFVRTGSPSPLGTPVSLDLKLPNGVELHADAVVVFVNAHGMGVKFALDEEAEEELSTAIAQISARPRRALVVDDDALQRRMLSDALAERGFEVVTAADGAEGIRVLSEELLALDLLVTDLKMPGMNGEAFVRMIRESGGELDLAIVAVTGSMGEGVERKLEQAGADAVLDKALGSELIAQAADAVVERKRLVRGRS